MEFRILGPLEVVSEGQTLEISSPQQRALLVLLVLNANRVLSSDSIADRIWDGRLPDSGTKALAFHVSRLRDALAPGRQHGKPAGGIETEAGGYVLRADPEAIDAIRFERLVRSGHDCLPQDPAGARALLAEGLGLWRGDALTDVAYADFAQTEIHRLEELRLDALEDRLEAELALGEPRVVVAQLEALLEANPLREHLRGLLMLALYRCGRQAEALRVAGAGRRMLSEELGIDPSPELVQLEGRILAQDPELASTPAARAGRPGPAGPQADRLRNPYKGLRPFGEADAADFFGREALLGRLVARLAEVARGGRLLAVVGPSGSGKSSVVLAGLLPALRAGALDGSASWRLATMVPGTDPFGELAAAIDGGGKRGHRALGARAERDGDLGPLIRNALSTGESRLVLVIDQLEALFVRVEPGTRERFIAALAGALRAPHVPLTVVATLRADFLHIPLASPELGPNLRDGTELVPPLTRSELERAIQRPAVSVGLEIEPALVAEAAADVEQRPGGLPLLQYALAELFERSDGQRLTRDGYHAIGGVAGALGRCAEEAWTALDRGGRDIAQQVALGIVTMAEEGIAMARPVARADLESVAVEPGEVAAVLEQLRRRGLLTFDVDRATGAPTVQLAHEALLTAWSRLAGWIEDLRDDLATRRRLAEATRDWESAGHSPEYLVTGARLRRFETWASATRLRLTDREQAYLETCLAERERVARAEGNRVARERGLERRTRIVRRALVAVLAAGITVAGGLFLALMARQQASVEDAAIGRARELASASVATLGQSRQLSVLLALEAVAATADRGYVAEEAYDALQWSLQEAQVAFPVGDPPVGVREAPGGPRGVFLVTPDVLMRLGADYVQRQLSTEECGTYLHAVACPPVEPPADGVALQVRTVAGVVPVSTLAIDSVIGTRVRVLSELPADISPLVGQFADAAGVSVRWDPATGGDLEARVEAGDLPDIAIVARPSYVATAGRDGWLIDLSGRLKTAGIPGAGGRYLMELGSTAVSGSSLQYGMPMTASLDDLLWYPKAAFEASSFAPPTTSDQLAALVARLRAEGHVPWCLGNEDGIAGAAWTENLLLDATSLGTYDRWASGVLPFASSEVRAAADAFAAGILPAGSVLNGIDSAAMTPDAIAILPMIRTDNPECWLYRGSSTMPANLGPKLAGRLAAVRFPGGPAAAGVDLGRTYMVVVLRDRPEVRWLADALLGAPLAATLGAQLCDDGLFPILEAPIPATCARAAHARRLHAALVAGSYRVRALDTFPPELATGFASQLGWSLHQAALAHALQLDDWASGIDWVWSAADPRTP